MTKETESVFNYKGYDAFPYETDNEEGNHLICENCGNRRGTHSSRDKGSTTVKCKKTIDKPVVLPTKKGYPPMSVMGAGVSDSEPKKVKPIEDLVKDAIKEALSKRGVTEGSVEASPEVVKEATEPTPKKEFKMPEPKDGQVWASKLFKQFRMGEKDFAVTVFKPEDWNEKIRGFVPVVDPTYVLNKEYATNILKGWEMGDKTLIYGPTGAGKSSIVEQLCAYTCRPFIRINCTGDMDSSMIFGQQTASDGSTHWVDGTVTEAVKYGAVFAWDEWDVTPPEIAMGLQWLLEENGKLFLKEMPGSSVDKFITPHKDFRLVALGNTQGQGDDTGNHSGTNVQNTATLDRFGTVIRIGYMKEDQEVSMIQGKFPDRAVDDTKNLVKWANLIRQGYQTGQLGLTVSPRATLGICKKLAFGYTLLESIELVYTNKLTETHQKVASELYRKVFGSKV